MDALEVGTWGLLACCAVQIGGGCLIDRERSSGSVCFLLSLTKFMSDVSYRRPASEPTCLLTFASGDGR